MLSYYVMSLASRLASGAPWTIFTGISYDWVITHSRCDGTGSCISLQSIHLKAALSALPDYDAEEGDFLSALP
jgi:hypothetical protein